MLSHEEISKFSDDKEEPTQKEKLAALAEQKKLREQREDSFSLKEELAQMKAVHAALSVSFLTLKEALEYLTHSAAHETAEKALNKVFGEGWSKKAI